MKPDRPENAERDNTDLLVGVSVAYRYTTASERGNATDVSTNATAPRQKRRVTRQPQTRQQIERNSILRVGKLHLPSDGPAGGGHRRPPPPWVRHGAIAISTAVTSLTPRSAAHLLITTPIGQPGHNPSESLAPVTRTTPLQPEAFTDKLFETGDNRSKSLSRSSRQHPAPTAPLVGQVPNFQLKVWNRAR